MRLWRCGVSCVFLSALLLVPPAGAETLAEALQREILQPGQATRQHVDFITGHIPDLKLPRSAEAWQAESARLRNRVLNEVVFRGVPRGWRAGRPRVVWSDEIKAEQGYTIRKLRYEALPGLWIPALLYEPDDLEGKVPVVLNTNGHDPAGKATPYKQLRSINLAKRGMVALNPEWLGMGQLRGEGYSHDHLAMLDLCGRSGLSVFYLAMSRGLDVLLDHPHADPRRVAVTGLSGGGWQTIVLSSLDERVTLAVPVAGYSAVGQRVVNRSSIGDLEQNPSDLISIADYAHLTALMVPRPTLLVYNAADNCCFVSNTVKPNTFDPVVPFFEQAGAGDVFDYYTNVDPGTHNYERDNREQLYRFLNKHFFPGHETPAEEIDSEDEIKTAEELYVPLPDDNATFHSLAAAVAADLPRAPANKSPAESRRLLRDILRYRPLAGKMEALGRSETDDGITIERFRLELGQQWQLPAIVASGRNVNGPNVNGPNVNGTVLMLADSGYADQAKRIVDLCAAGSRVICIDPILIGQSTSEGEAYPNAVLLGTVGHRPLGIQTAQVSAAAALFCESLSLASLDLVTHGPRSGLAAICTAALDAGGHIGQVHSNAMPASLKAFIEPGASYRDTPEIYCFGLLESFDLPQLRKLGQAAE